MLRVEHASGGYFNHLIITDMSFSIPQGEFFGIIGPNGSGKTTLLKMLSGLIPCQSGSIYVQNKEINHYSKKEKAKVIAVLPQLATDSFPYSVKETVELGRYAHQNGIFHRWTKEDTSIVEKVMMQTNIIHLQHQSLHELSGGEQQRVFLAQALAQEPAIILLDEPTNHLDLAHQKELLDLLKHSTSERYLTVVAIFHDLNLASLYCDRLLMIQKGQIETIHTPDEVLTETTIQNVYQTKVMKYPHPKVPKPQIHMLPDQPKSEKENITIQTSMLEQTKTHIALRTPIPLRTLSTSVFGGGIGWHSQFVIPYGKNNAPYDFYHYLVDHHFTPHETVVIETGSELVNVAYQDTVSNDISLLTVVTCSFDQETSTDASILLNSINICIFINGSLTDEAFIQAIMSATEAKNSALNDLSSDDKKISRVKEKYQDHILIAATQTKPNYNSREMTTNLHTSIKERVCKEIVNATNMPLDKKR